jgi:hypothetical protein
MEANSKKYRVFSRSMLITWGSFRDNRVDLREVFDFLKAKLKELQYLFVSKENS